MEKESLIPRIENLMEEYYELKKLNERLYSRVESSEKMVKDLTKGYSKPNFNFISTMQTNIISIEKEIGSTIMNMKNIKKDIIDLLMKESKLGADDESEGNFNNIAKQLLMNLNSKPNEEIIKDIVSSNEDTEEDDYKDELDKVLSDFTEEDNDTKKEIKEIIQEADTQDLKTLLLNYEEILNFYAVQRDEENFYIVVTDKENQIIETNELKDDYNEIYLLTKDLNLEQLDDEYAVDIEGNKFSIAEL